MEKKTGPGGLYIHIPFCRRKCPYCNFYSETGTGLVDDFLDALAQEAGPFRGLVFSSVYFGGGTPSVLSPRQWERLFRILEDNFGLDPSAEITAEVNPESASKDLLKTMRALGIRRLSVGAQSGLDPELETLGRPHRVRDTEKCLENALSAGFVNINFDLMFGFPGQTPRSWKRTLLWAAGLPITHISTYALTPNQNIRPLPESETIRLYEIRDEILGARGFHRYEISNYARGGAVCRHNLLYWRHGEYLGLGPSASSFLGNKRWKNHPSLGSYLRGPPFPRSMETLSGEQLALERVFLGLRLSEGVELGLKSVPEGLRGLVEVKDGRVSLTPRGVLVADAVALELSELEPPGRETGNYKGARRGL